MPYLINRYNGEPLLTLNDGELNDSTSLTLLGKNYIGYGEIQNENFIHLLENFSGDIPPPRPISGQCWYDRTTKNLKVYDGASWSPLGSSSISDVEPQGTPDGSLWFKIPQGVLYVKNQGVWNQVVSEFAEGFGVTRARSTTIRDNSNNSVPVILLTVNNAIVAVISDRDSTINIQTALPGFSSLKKGITISNLLSFNGDLQGNASTATRLVEAKTINGIAFDGQADISIKANTNGVLRKGDYISGSDFDGSTTTTWSVDATPNNTIGKIVARNAFGDFSANTITANLIGNVTGNVNAPSGTSVFDTITVNQIIGASLSGNAFSATRLANPRRINGVSFDGTADINVTVAANVITGSDLSTNIINSNLRTVGDLTNLEVTGAVKIGSGAGIQLTANDNIPVISSLYTNLPLRITVAGTTGGLQLIPAAISLAQSGDNKISLTPTLDGSVNLGHPNFKFDKIYFNQLIGSVAGNSDTATLAVRATNLSGGAAGSIAYQLSPNTTAMLPAGVPGQILKTAGTNGAPYWASLDAISLAVHSPGQHLLGGGYDGNSFVTWSVDATDQNTPGKIVLRNSSGDFSARNVSVNQLDAATSVTAPIFIGDLNGNALTANRLSQSIEINGVQFDGSITSITIEDSTKINRSGDTMTGFLSLHASPTSNSHAATKLYVDNKFGSIRFTYGFLEVLDFTNQVGSFNNAANYFDVFPPTGLTMSNLQAFIPSIRTIYYAGTVNIDDAVRCEFTVLSDRVRVFVQNTEQRAKPTANYLAIWR